jgi:predicted nuclease of predicted toxin-antitoxin system
MLLADENIPAGTISQLRQRGFDVLSVREVSPGISDDAVLQLATQQQRILVSFDRDYGELIFKQGRPAPPAVIYFRLQPSSPEELTELLVWLLGDGAGSINDKMVIVRKQGVRERPLR